MGFSTNVTISNDFWHDIAKDPQKLVDAIQEGMSEGAGGESPISDTLDAQDGSEWRRRYANERRYYVAPQGVVVHKAQHNDTAQVIVNTYGSRAIAAHEIPSAIAHGWLDLDTYNEQHAEEIAKELHRLAASIRKTVRNVKAGKSPYA